ncbi:MAG: SDR family oxidoreductase [Treponemataceae bacterium]|nr:MAG: SDR family oxidoreductase [Treponemataceae bacterium]
MKIFITGGTGNIGQYVTKELLAAGHSLVMLTRTPERIPHLTEQKNVTAVRGTILDFEVMEQALVGCDAVIHIALGWGNTPTAMLTKDTLVTAFLAEKAEQAGAKNFVYTSSTAASGHWEDGLDENAILTPVDLYGATKAAAEMFLLGFDQYYTGQGKAGEKTKLRRNIIRPGYTFSNPAFPGGASQSDVRFRDIARAVLKGEDITLSPNDGTQFISAAQIAQVYRKIVESGSLNKEVFYALGKQFTTWVEIAKMAIDLAGGTKSTIKFPKGDETEKKHDLISVEKIKRVLNLEFDATDALREHIRWNIEREQKVLAGEKVHDVYHVW